MGILCSLGKTSVSASGTSLDANRHFGAELTREAVQADTGQVGVASPVSGTHVRARVLPASWWWLVLV